MLVDSDGYHFVLGELYVFCAALKGVRDPCLEPFRPYFPEAVVELSQESEKDHQGYHCQTEGGQDYVEYLRVDVFDGQYEKNEGA